MTNDIISTLISQGSYGAALVAILVVLLRYFMRRLASYEERMQKLNDEMSSLIRVHYAAINEHMQRTNDVLREIAEALKELKGHAGSGEISA